MREPNPEPARPHYVETIKLDESEQSIIAACEFMAGHVAAPFVAALDLWTDDPKVATVRSTALRQCRDRNVAIALKVETIRAHLSQLQHHTNPEVAALYEPISKSFKLLEQIETIGQQVEALISANMDALVDKNSQLAKELLQLEAKLNSIQTAFRPLELEISTSPAYQSYRAVIGEGRHSFNPRHGMRTTSQ